MIPIIKSFSLKSVDVGNVSSDENKAIDFFSLKLLQKPLIANDSVILGTFAIMPSGYNIANTQTQIPKHSPLKIYREY